MIKFFFAVTMTGVYRVGKFGCYGYAKKIASKAQSDVGVGEKLENGYLIAVGVKLIAYVPEGHSMLSSETSYVRELEKVNTRWWGGCTSPIVGLFKSKRKALDCLKADDPKPGDKRFWEQTKAVLEAIGSEHPTFYVIKDRDLALLPEVESIPA